MQFTYDITIAPNTPETDPEKLICRLSYGTISRVFVCFPPGPKGLAHVVIKRYESQVWPTNHAASFAWDDYVYVIEDEFDLTDTPYTVKLEGWNFDDTYPHTITVMFNVLRGRYGMSELLALQSPFSQLEV